MWNKVYSLDRWDDLECTRFKKEYFENKKPVIISNSFKWEALKKWNLDYLSRMYPDKIVTLAVFKPAINMPGSEIKLKLPEVIDLISHNTDKEIKYYLMQRSVYDEFPELVPDIATPKYADNKHQHTVNLWFGEKGVNTKGHYDYSNNFLMQIFGRKRVRLFAPTDTPNMHHYSMNDMVTMEGVHHPAIQATRIADMDLMDVNEFPNIKLATPFEGVLYPGDLLYIPAGWWHEIKSLDVAMSINFWWKIKIEDFPSSQLTSVVCSYFIWYSESFHEKIRLAFDLTEFSDDLQVAEFCLLKDLKFVSILFLLSYLDKILGNSNVRLNTYKIADRKKYLEIVKNGHNELLDGKKILDIIDEVKSLQGVSEPSSGILQM